ncbi:MAG: pre-peptidase C-terminal domain-containing protein [Chloroflexi bacterium]|nr:pre-peptidase C-terminal domain-containing protein [Chloroflexota bacterium]
MAGSNVFPSSTPTPLVVGTRELTFTPKPGSNPTYTATPTRPATNTATASATGTRVPPVTMTPAPSNTSSMTATRPPATATRPPATATASPTVTTPAGPTATPSDCPDPYEPNDTPNQATLLSGNGIPIQAYICAPGDSDYYKVNIRAGQVMTVELSNLPEDYDLELYDFRYSEDFMAYSQNGGNQDERIIYLALESGAYYIRVVPYAGFNKTRSYTLRATVTDVAFPKPLKTAALIYKDNLADATQYEVLLRSSEFGVSLIQANDLLSTDLSRYNLVIVANDTTGLWRDAALVAHVSAQRKPLLVMGDGGYQLLMALGLQVVASSDLHLDQDNRIQVLTPNLIVYHAYYPISVPRDGMLRLYHDPVPRAAINLSLLPTTAVVVGRDPQVPSSYPVIRLQDGILFWGFPRPPRFMLAEGWELFANSAWWMQR